MNKRKLTSKTNFTHNKTICTLACLSVLTFSANICNAEDAQYIPEGYYIGANLGFAMASDSDIDYDTSLALPDISIEWDNGYAINAALGYNFGNNLRLEGEIGYQKNDADKVKVSGLGSVSTDGDLSNTSFLVNGYFDMTNGGPIATIFSAGVGIAKLDDGDVDDTVLAYQVGVGFGYMISETYTIDLKYRYFATEDPDFGSGIEMDYSTHNVYLGVRMSL